MSKGLQMFKPMHYYASSVSYHPLGGKPQDKSLWKITFAFQGMQTMWENLQHPKPIDDWQPLWRPYKKEKYRKEPAKQVEITQNRPNSWY